MLLVFILYHVRSCDSGCDLWQPCEGDDALGLLQHQRSISRIPLLRDFSSAASVLHASINHILSVLLVNWRCVLRLHAGKLQRWCQTETEREKAELRPKKENSAI